MVMENKCGLMNLDMKEVGQMTKPMDLVNCIMQMVTFMRESGKMIRLMVEVPIHMLMELDIQETGRMINNMVMALKHGLMEQYMKVSIMKERRMEKVN
jgi:hypothetical protein